jgi:RNA polymerase-binding transcription factor DksA
MTHKRKKAPYSKALLSQLRKRILAARERAEHEVDDLGQLALSPSDSENGLEEPAETGSEEYAQEINLELLDQESSFLRELDAALERLDGEADTPFGLCEACEEEPAHECTTCPWIPQERLRNSPWVRNCAQMQARLEQASGESGAGRVES